MQEKRFYFHLSICVEKNYFIEKCYFWTMNYFGFLKNILWLNNLIENCANSPKTETDGTWGEKKWERKGSDPSHCWLLGRLRYCYCTAVAILVRHLAS